MIRAYLTCISQYIHSLALYRKTNRFPERLGQLGGYPLIDQQCQYLVVESQDLRFAYRFLSPRFRMGIDNMLVMHLHCEFDDMTYVDFLPLIKEAYANIPSDRPILQFLVDLHFTCRLPRSPGRMDELPKAFLVRIMRRMHQEQLRTRRSYVSSHSPCYYEHTSVSDLESCRSAHME